MHQQRGFTLIELMIVVAIIAILAALALPAYQDYVTRSQVSEGLSLATAGRVALATHYAEHGNFPNDNVDAGMATPTSISGPYVTSVTVDNTGSISILFSGTANARVSGQTLVMTATDNNGSIRWSCGGLDPKYMPSSCR